MAARADLRFLTSALALALLPASAAAQSNQRTDEVLSVNVLGDLESFATPNPGRVHVSGATGVATADYFRGAYDNVEADLDELAFPLALSATFELWRDRADPVRDLSLALGTANNLSSDEDHPLLGEDGHWYESDNFVGLAAGLGENWRAGLTYSIYTSPLGDLDPLHEVALAATYAGPGLPLGLTPQVKIAVPVVEGEGAFASISAGPSVTVNEGGTYPVTLTVPVTLGVGFDDYYGPGTGTTGYLGTGVGASVPLEFIPKQDYGAWTLAAGLDLLFRAEDLQDAQPAFADDALVAIGRVTLSFRY